MSRFSVTFVESLRDIRPAELNALGRGRDFSVSYPWLATVEGIFPLRLHVALRDGADRLIAFTSIYRCDREPGDPYEPRSLFLEALGVEIPDGGVFLVGTPDGYSNCLLLHPGLSPDEQREARSFLLGAVGQFAQEHNSLPVMLYLTNEGVSSLAGAATSPPLLVEISALMDVSACTLDEHLRHMKAGRRRKVRGDWRAFQNAGYEITTARLSECVDLMATLSYNLQLRYGQKASIEDERVYAQSQTKFLDELSTVVLCSLQGEVVGFAHIVRWGNAFYARSCGFDYARIRMAGEYGSVFFYWPMKLAVEIGIRKIHYGIGSLEAKLLHGCYPVPLWAVLLGGWSTSVDSNLARTWNRRVRKRRAEAADRLSPGYLDRWLPPPMC